MADRSVRVRLEADISDFVSDIGVKAVAAVKRLEGAATKADVTLKKTGTTGSGIGDGVAAGTTKATTELKKLADTADKTMTETGAKARKTAKAEFAKAGAEAAESFDKETKKRFPKSGDESGKSFGSGFKKWLTGGGGGLFSELGKSGGTVFGSGFLGALKTPIIGPAIVAVLSAALLTVMPAVGAVAGGALVAGFGAGIAGLGILFAAKSEAVGKKWETTLGQLGADMKLLSQPFEGTLINIASIFQRTVDKFNPTLAKAFKDTAGPVEAFVARFAGSLEQLIPAIDPVVRAFNSVLDSLGPAFQSLIGDMAASLNELAVSVERNPDGLADMVTGLGEVLGTAMQLIQVLNDVNGSFETLTGGTSLVDVVMEGLQATMMPLLTLFSGLGKVIDLANAALGKTGKDVEGAGQSMADAANKTITLAGALDKTGAAAQHGAAPMRTMEERVAAAKKAAADAKEKFEGLIDAMFRMQAFALSVSAAQIQMQDALVNASKVLKENGKGLDIHTAKGRENRNALNGVAQAAQNQTEAMLRSGQANGVAADANVDAYNAAVLSTKGFVKLAMQMGATKPQAEAMARAMITIPNVTRTAKLNANKKDLEAKLRDANKALENKNLTKERRAKLTVDKKNAEAGIAAINRALGNLPTSKTITINTYRNMIETTINRGLVASGKGVPQADGGFWPKGIPSYADGKLPSQAMVAQGKGAGLVQWAEGETGGEAFIPLAPSKRDRSEKILGQVADTFGMGLVRSHASGAYLPPGPTFVGNSGPAGNDLVRRGDLNGMRIKLDAGGVGTLTGYIQLTAEDVVQQASEFAGTMSRMGAPR